MSKKKIRGEGEKVEVPGERKWNGRKDMVLKRSHERGSLEYKREKLNVYIKMVQTYWLHHPRVIY